MPRRSGILHTLAQAQREAERQRAAQQRAETKAARDAEQARKAFLRAQAQTSKEVAQAQKAAEKEQARLYLESRTAQVALQNEELAEEIAQLNAVLAAALNVDSFLDLKTLKQYPEIPHFFPGTLALAAQAPTLKPFLPDEPSGLSKLIPGWKEKHARNVAEAHNRYQDKLAVHQQAEAARLAQLAAARAEYERHVAKIAAQVTAQHTQIEQLQRDLAARIPEAIVDYFSMILEGSNYPDGFPQKAKLAYVPESKQLVIEYDLPPFERIPTASTYKYTKTKDEITAIPQPLPQRKILYASVIAQITLRVLHELFEADRTLQIETVVFNGYVDSIDRGTGRPRRTCLATVRTSRDTFTQLNLGQVDPVACLKVLNAEVSKSPTELAPVRPVLEFDMVDPRFIEGTDVLSTLDQRPNLMALTPSEFEALIANLFQAMGLETRLTQASRDGGVDCVAYDPRPILGGKVVIQAKRYKHTVGVSAVRDLYGTLQNEGASKGILVTTSGFGTASFEFAKEKPLELLSGSHLLYLLATHAGIEAKIEPPENWRDPQPDAPQS